MTKRIGPSMSTEPGWMAARRASPLLLGEATVDGRNDASMLLSFERPASAGARGTRRKMTCRNAREPAGVVASPRSLKTAQKPHQPPSISGG
jgi:hypothetical protein